MAIDEKERSARADAWEKASDKHLAKIASRVDRIPQAKGRNRVDGLLWTGGERAALYDTKWLSSGGWDPVAGAHMSSLDPDAHAAIDGPSKVLVVPAVPPGLRDAAEKGVLQYRETVEDLEDVRGLPFLLVVDTDGGARLDAADFDFPDLPELSGVLVAERDRLRLAALASESPEQLERRMATGDTKGTPPPTFEWRLFENPGAAIKIPQSIRSGCLLGRTGGPTSARDLDAPTREHLTRELEALSPDARWVLREMARAGTGMEAARGDSTLNPQPPFDELIRSGAVEVRDRSGYGLTPHGWQLAEVESKA